MKINYALNPVICEGRQLSVICGRFSQLGHHELLHTAHSDSNTFFHMVEQVSISLYFFLYSLVKERIQQLDSQLEMRTVPFLGAVTKEDKFWEALIELKLKNEDRIIDKQTEENVQGRPLFLVKAHREPTSCTVVK